MHRLKTQIGGKYDASDSSIFSLKRSFEHADIVASHPMSDGIVTTIGGRGFTFDPQKITFLEVETDYYNSIATSDFHTVNNRFHDELGYIGGSASLEMAYAMLNRKPILLMHQPKFAMSADPFCKEILMERQSLVTVHDLSSASSQEIRAVSEAVAGQNIEYNLGATLGGMIMQRVDQLFDDIRNNPLH